MYGDREAAADRFVARYLSLPEAVRRRLVLENSEVSSAAAEAPAIHERTGVPLVFDNLHHRVNNPAGWGDSAAMRVFLATWPQGQTPKIHFSSQRASERTVVRRDHTPGVQMAAAMPPRPEQHDDVVDAQEFVALVGAVQDIEFDVMLEAKQKDLAILRLREDLAAIGQSELAW